MSNSLTPEVAEFIKLREALGWSQRRTASELGVDGSRVSRMEKGRLDLPNGFLIAMRALAAQAPAAPEGEAA